ncbi:hypothetical protein GQ42DRAFT_152549 [Ramicandelaber brevisporus]|nr:hypothetical protein GQ42DRAFT_152549 [Ramicandelaber brevisporus]
MKTTLIVLTTIAAIVQAAPVPAQFSALHVDPHIQLLSDPTTVGSTLMQSVASAGNKPAGGVLPPPAASSAGPSSDNVIGTDGEGSVHEESKDTTLYSFGLISNVVGVAPPPGSGRPKMTRPKPVDQHPSTH